MIAHFKLLCKFHGTPKVLWRLLWYPFALAAMLLLYIFVVIACGVDKGRELRDRLR